MANELEWIDAKKWSELKKCVYFTDRPDTKELCKYLFRQGRYIFQTLGESRSNWTPERFRIVSESGSLWPVEAGFWRWSGKSAGHRDAIGKFCQGETRNKVTATIGTNHSIDFPEVSRDYIVGSAEYSGCHPHPMPNLHHVMKLVEGKKRKRRKRKRECNNRDWYCADCGSTAIWTKNG